MPTQASGDAWLASSYPSGKLRTCPLGVDVERFQPAREPLLLLQAAGWPVADYRVRVLNVSEPSPRKNLTGLVRTWITATSADDDAILIIKCGPSTRLAHHRAGAPARADGAGARPEPAGRGSDCLR